MIHDDEITCPDARERLSARLDGELSERDELALRAHLSRCGECRAHERALGGLARGFDRLRAAAGRGGEPLADLWPRIELGRRELGRAARRPGAPRIALARAAAALVGFASLGALALALERERPAPRARHLSELLAPLATPDALLAELPEYRLLRSLPHETETR